MRPIQRRRSLLCGAGVRGGAGGGGVGAARPFSQSVQGGGGCQEGAKQRALLRVGRREPPAGGGAQGPRGEQVSLESPRGQAAGAKPQVGTSSQGRLGVYSVILGHSPSSPQHYPARQAGGSVLSVDL